MSTRFIKIALTGLAASALLSSVAFAQEAPIDPGHPRVNEVDQRLDNQQNRINNNVNKGDMSPGQAARDEKRDTHVENELHKDEAKHGGHVTKREQRRMNRQLNKNSRDIHRQHNHAVKAKQ